MSFRKEASLNGYDTISLANLKTDAFYLIMVRNLLKQEKKLEDVDSIILSDEETEEIVSDKVSKAVFAGALEFVGLGAIVKVLETAEKIKEEITQKKKNILLVKYFSDVNHIQKEINKLKEFVSDPVGNTLFNKIIRIVDTNPPNKYYLELFAKVLKKIINSDFQKLFSKHIYTLNQIEKLTPQALIILADYGSWPEYYISRYATRDGIITTDWIEEFLLYYIKHKKISDDELSRRIAHSLRELFRNDLIRSKMQKETDSKDIGSIKESIRNLASCELTELGTEIVDYID